MAAGRTLENHAHDWLEVMFATKLQRTLTQDAKQLAEIEFRVAFWDKIFALHMEQYSFEWFNVLGPMKAADFELKALQKGEIAALLELYAADASFDAAVMDRMMASGMLPKPVAQVEIED